jgi:hypothetical protein
VNALIVAAISLPLAASRGAHTPDWSVVASYVEREAVASTRLALIGVAIGVLAAGRGRVAAAILAGFLVVEGVLASHSTLIRDFGPVGALNAFSDPSHMHRLSLGAGSAIALAWALAALIAAALVLDARGRRIAG